MPKLIIENFKAGLDDRRDALATLPGALVTLNNAHINQGGAIEKRKGFFRLGDADMPAETYGLENTSDGLVTFGSATTPAGLPSGVTYQRLQHPDGSSTMTGVVVSCNFAGNAFVIASFSDGAVLAFYNGTIVTDFIAGLILAYMNTLPEIADVFEDLVDATGYYTATQRANPNDDKVDVYGYPGNAYTNTISVTSAAGTLASSQVTEYGTPAEDAISAVGRFTIVAGTNNPGVNRISQVFVYLTNILGTAVDWATSNEATASAVATQINSNQTTYAAKAIGNVVEINKVVAGVVSGNNSLLSVVVEGNVCVIDCSFTLSGSDFEVSSVTANSVELTSASWRATPGTSDNYPAVDSDLTDFCAALAADITSGSGTHGYVACSVGARVYVSLLIAGSVGTGFNLVVTINGDGSTGAGAGTGNQANISTTRLVLFNLSSYPPNLFKTQSKVLASPIGGTPEFTYRWRESTPGSSNGIVPQNERQAKTGFVYFAPPGTYVRGGQAFSTLDAPVSGLFVCEITDSLGVVAVSPEVTVTS